MIYPPETGLVVLLCLSIEISVNSKNDVTLTLHNLVTVTIVALKIWGGGVEVRKRKIILGGGIYRHPKGKVQHVVGDMEAILIQLEQNITYVIIGDADINMLNCEFCTRVTT